MSNAVWVALADIRISERGRRNISASTVERYRRWLEQGREPPPVRLRRGGDGFLGAGRPAPRGRRTGRGPRLHRGGRSTRKTIRSMLASAAGADSGGRALGAPLACTERGAGSIPAVSTVGPQHEVGDCTRGRAPGSWVLPVKPAQRAREDEGSNPFGSTIASVVSTASTRPLYGRGAGSTPAGGSFRRP
jgi:hypothetical protein